MPFIREWLGRDDKHLEPPPPPAPEPDLTTVRFVAGFSGRQASPDYRFMCAYGAGDVAAFGPIEADLLIRLGVAEKVPDKEPEAP
jgi:hypothetical protein